MEGHCMWREWFQVARVEDPCGTSNVGTARSQAWRRMEKENEACGVSSSDKQVFLGAPKLWPFLLPGGNDVKPVESHQALL